MILTKKSGIFYYEIDNTYLHNGEMLDDVGYKSIDDYATYDELDNDVYGDIRKNTLISNNLKYYLLWLKPLENIEIDNGKPICGKDADSAIPVGPDGLKIYDLYWEDSNKNEVDVFEGDNEYTCYVDMDLPYRGVLWKYFINKDNVNINVVGGSDIEIIDDDDDDYLVSFKTKVEHDWTYWSVVKEPTDTEDGLKERYCSICNKKETQVIPMNYSCGIELDVGYVELQAEEGYKGSTEEGLDEDAISQTITAKSIGSEEVEFIMAGFLNAEGVENFTLIVGNMQATIAPKTGLEPGVYETTIEISDFYDRYLPIEVPVRFKVTEKGVEYSNIAGENQKWVKGSKKDAIFTFKRNIDDDNTIEQFAGVLVDDIELIPEEDYSYSVGSVIINLKASYLEKLAVGEHTLTVRFNDGNDVTTKFSISNPVPAYVAPKTGTENTIVINSELISLLTVAFAVISKKDSFKK